MPIQKRSADRRVSLWQAVKEIDALQPISPACTQVLRVASDQRSSVDDLAAVIDPALTSRLLQLANAAQYGRVRGVGTLRDAVLLLGFGVVRAVAMSGSIALGFGARNRSFDARRFWLFSATVAQLAEVIASAYRRHRDDAATAGALHGIGRLALAQFHPDLLDQAQRLAVENRTSLSEAEHELFGFTDAELGGALAARWHFPDSLVEAIKQHDLDPLAHDRGGSFAADISRARRYARAYGLADGIEPRRRGPPDAEWYVAPLSTALSRAGGMPELRQRAETFVDRALGLGDDAAAA